MKKIMILAGGNDQAALIEELRLHFQDDVQIILVDYAKDVVASKFADKHLVISTMDLDAVKKAALEEGVDYIMTACGDQPLLTMAAVSEELGLPCYLSKEQVLELTNKKYMKKKMVDNGIPTSRFKTFSSKDTLDVTGLQFPLIVKPVDSNGSKGVRKVTTLEELKDQAKLSFQFALSDTIIVEEFVEGVEISSDFYIIDGQAKFIMMSELNKYAVDESTAVIYQTIIPPAISPIAHTKLLQIAQQIATTFHVTNSPLLIQSIVRGDEVSVIEFSARIGGGAKYKDIQNVTGFNILRANLQSMLGLHPIVDAKTNENYYSRCHLYVMGGKFKSIEGIQELLNENVITEYVQTKPFGVKVNAPRSSADRVASIFLQADNIITLNNKIMKAITRIQVFDESRVDILFRDMYLVVHQ